MRTAELAWVAIGQGAGAIGGLALIKTQGLLLAPEELGSLLLALNLALLVQGVLFAGPGATAARYGATACDLGEGRLLARDLAALAFRRLLLALPLATTVAGLLALSGHLSWSLALGGVLLGLLGAASSLLEGWMLSLARQKALALVQVITQGTRLAGMIVGAGMIAGGSIGALVGLGAGAAATLATQAWLLRKPLPASSPPTRDWRQESRMFARPYLAWGAVAWAQAATERWSLQLAHGAGSVGLYGAMYQLCFAPMGLLSSIITSYTAPRIFRGWETRTDRALQLRRWRMVALAGLVLVALASLGAWATARIVIPLAASEAYLPAAPLLPLLLASAGCFGLAQAIATPLLATGSTTINRAKLISPLVGAAGAAGLAPFFGSMGVTWAGLAANGLYLAWLLVVLTRCERAERGTT